MALAEFLQRLLRASIVASAARPEAPPADWELPLTSYVLLHPACAVLGETGEESARAARDWQSAGALRWPDPYG